MSEMSESERGERSERERAMRDEWNRSLGLVPSRVVDGVQLYVRAKDGE